MSGLDALAVKGLSFRGLLPTSRVGFSSSCAISSFDKDLVLELRIVFSIVVWVLFMLAKII